MLHKRQQRGIIDSVTVRWSRAETINTQSKLQQRVKSIVVRLKGNRGRQINRLALIRFAVEVGIAEVFVVSGLDTGVHPRIRASSCQVYKHDSYQVC